VDGTSRSKDMIEVLEVWWKEPDGVYCVVIGNRKVELRAPEEPVLAWRVPVRRLLHPA
jgi:hypothetical protein